MVKKKKNPPANAGDTAEPGSIPGSGRSPGGGNVSPLQYSCLGNPMDRGAWRAPVHRLQSQTQLSDSTHAFIIYFWLCCLCCYASFSLAVASGGSSLAAVCGLLNVGASLVEHRL